MHFDDPEKTAREGIDALQKFLISIGMPSTFADIGAKEEDIPKLVQVLCYGNGRTGSLGGFMPLNEEDCANVYKMML